MLKLRKKSGLPETVFITIGFFLLKSIILCLKNINLDNKSGIIRKGKRI
jgi:hypothetical protein